MKRFALGLPLLFFVAIGPSLGQGEKKILSHSSDLLPLKVGNRWIYQGIDPKEKVVVVFFRRQKVARENGRMVPLSLSLSLSLFSL